MDHEESREKEAEEAVASSGRIVLSRERLERVRGKRYHYLVLYGFIVAGWAVFRVVEMRGGHVPGSFTWAVVACQVLFYIQFAGVLHALGYRVWMIVALCVLVFVPVPGLLILAVLDRRVYRVLDGTAPD